MGWKKELIKNENFNTYDIKAFDIDGDSFLDIIESNSDDLNYYYINKKNRLDEKINFIFLMGFHFSVLSQDLKGLLSLDILELLV